MSTASYITSVSLSLILFCALSAERLSSEFHQISSAKDIIVHVSNRGTVVMECKKTGRMELLPSADTIFCYDNRSLSLKVLVEVGFVVSPEEFATAVPPFCKPFYMVGEDKNYHLSVGGFVIDSPSEYHLLSPERAAQEELRRERTEEDQKKYLLPLLRCSSPVHRLKCS